MKKLSLNRKKNSKTQNESQSQQQPKISSFLNVFKTPEQAAKKEEANDMIENTPEAEEEVVNKKRKLFKRNLHGSRVGRLFANSTTSLIAGNLDKKATKVYSPPPMPKCEEAKKRPLTPDNT